MSLDTMPNEKPGNRFYQRHCVPLPSCCPISGNPQPGSEITVSYRVTESVLEVYSLERYLQSYVGGHVSGVRNMESMLQQVADDCAKALGVKVMVRAVVILQSGRMEAVCEARP